MATLNDIETKIRSIITILKSRIVKTITGILPLTFTANAGNAVDWSISGNDNAEFEPYQIGVGKRTANLFNIEKATAPAISIDGYAMTKSATGYNYDIFNGTTGLTTDFDIENSIYLEAGVYTISFISSSNISIVKKSDASADVSVVLNGYSSGSHFTLEQAAYISIRISTNLPIVVQNLMLAEGSTADFIPYGYEVPLTISQTGQTDKNYDIYIGDSPLTAGQSVSKASTGVDLELFEGENTVSTTLYNKPEMTIKYKYNGGN